jgi:hypothetical protein
MDPRRYLRLPSPALVVALIALSVSLVGHAGAFRGGGHHHLVRKGDIAPGAVTARALGKGVVHAGALATGAVHPRALAAGSVGAFALASGAVGSGALAPDAVTATALAPGSVYGGALREETVHTTPIADLDAIPSNIEWTASNTEAALCAPGEALLSAGFAFGNPGNREAAWLQAMPFTNGEKRGVSGQITTNSGGSATAEVAALCLK